MSSRIHVLKVRLRSFQNKNMLWKFAKIACLTKPCFWRTIKEKSHWRQTIYFWNTYCTVKFRSWKNHEKSKSSTKEFISLRHKRTLRRFVCIENVTYQHTFCYDNNKFINRIKYFVKLIEYPCIFFKILFKSIRLSYSSQKWVCTVSELKLASFAS